MIDGWIDAGISEMAPLHGNAYWCVVIWIKLGENENTQNVWVSLGRNLEKSYRYEVRRILYMIGNNRVLTYKELWMILGPWNLGQ